MKNVSEFQENQKLAYTTQEDVFSVFPGCTVFAIQAPPGTCVEVGPPSRVFFAFRISFQELSFSRQNCCFLKIVDGDGAS